MQAKKAKQLNELSLDALKKLRAELGEELRVLRFKRMNGEVKQNHMFKQYRKTIARIETLLSQKSRTE